MARRLHTNQPPIDRAGRPFEGRTLWIGLLIVGIGAALVVSGLLLPTGVKAAGGVQVTEPQARQRVRTRRRGRRGCGADGQPRRQQAVPYLSEVRAGHA